MKKAIWFIILVLVVVLAWWFLAGDQATAPTGDQTTQEQTVDQDLQAVPAVNLDAEFQTVDQDINQL